MERILPMDEAMSLVKKGYRAQIVKVWEEFCTKSDESYDNKVPQEGDFISFIKHLREEKNRLPPQSGQSTQHDGEKSIWIFSTQVPSYFSFMQNLQL